MGRRKDIEIEFYSDGVVLKQCFGNGKKQKLIKAKTLKQLIEKLDGELYEIVFGKGDW